MILSVSRHTSTSLDAVEEWDIDRFIAYARTLARQLRRERGKGRG